MQGVPSSCFLLQQSHVTHSGSGLARGVVRHSEQLPEPACAELARQVWGGPCFRSWRAGGFRTNNHMLTGTRNGAGRGWRARRPSGRGRGCEQGEGAQMAAAGRPQGPGRSSASVIGWMADPSTTTTGATGSAIRDSPPSPGCRTCSPSPARSPRRDSVTTSATGDDADARPDPPAVVKTNDVPVVTWCVRQHPSIRTGRGGSIEWDRGSRDLCPLRERLIGGPLFVTEPTISRRSNRFITRDL